MPGRRYVLDTSALLALIEGEAGADRVAGLLRTESCLLPAAALMEVHYITRQERGSGEADRRYALLAESGQRVCWDLDERVILTASRYKANLRLSFADSLIAAVAKTQRAVLVHKDPEYEALAGEVLLEALPYKASGEAGKP